MQHPILPLHSVVFLPARLTRMRTHALVCLNACTHTVLPTCTPSRRHVAHETQCSPTGSGDACLPVVARRDREDSTRRLQVTLQKIIDKVKALPEAQPFLFPVEPSPTFAPDYFKVILDPMDLQTVEQRLHARNFYVSKVSWFPLHIFFLLRHNNVITVWVGVRANHLPLQRTSLWRT